MGVDMSVIKWKSMQGLSGERGEKVVTIWKSKKVAWHWVALYRHVVRRNKVGIRTTYGSFEIRWNFRKYGYSLTFMEWLGFPRKFRWFRP